MLNRSGIFMGKLFNSTEHHSQICLLHETLSSKLETIIVLGSDHNFNSIQLFHINHNETILASTGNEHL